MARHWCGNCSGSIYMTPPQNLRDLANYTDDEEFQYWFRKAADIIDELADAIDKLGGTVNWGSEYVDEQP